MLFIVFVLAPAVFGLWISLTNWSPFRATQKFIGLQNYIDLFTPGSATSGDFWQSMAATGIFTLASVPFLLLIPLLVAVLLNQKIRAGSFFRGVFFAPYVLGVAVISVIWKYLLDTQAGIINHLLRDDRPPGQSALDRRRPVGMGHPRRRDGVVDHGLQHRDHPRRASRASAPTSTRRPHWTARAPGASSSASRCRDSARS
ncbi:carbohydrate ABC transporter permease [Leifsonia sp. L25]|uniref:carbohydrate ABC transporter permease n=1 Tax=Leifsonia sp. L25 TaxID=3423957 RepID=UPI003D696C02